MFVLIGAGGIFFTQGFYAGVLVAAKKKRIINGKNERVKGRTIVIQKRINRKKKQNKNSRNTKKKRKFKEEKKLVVL